MSLLLDLGVDQLRGGTWAFTDMGTATNAHIHHSRKPVALAAYTMVNPLFAAGRFPSYILTDLVDQMPCLDSNEYAALAMVCGAPAPAQTFSEGQQEVFGETLLQVIDEYGLEGCFERVPAWAGPGLHFTVRPRGYAWDGVSPISDTLRDMRKCYKGMTEVKKIMVLTIIHLYSQGPDRHFLRGVRQTKFHAAYAIDTLRNNGSALATWGQLVSNYAGW
ncbi:hypothetical protein ACI77O_12380 [Pseudomonas tritici]|uniref:hypothetical protein n=1 Tax=Pseudomonas tritici TaxID=2745518 RepID=UPI00387B94D9